MKLKPELQAHTFDISLPEDLEPKDLWKHIQSEMIKELQEYADRGQVHPSIYGIDEGDRECRQWFHQKLGIIL